MRKFIKVCEVVVISFFLAIHEGYFCPIFKSISWRDLRSNMIIFLHWNILFTKIFNKDVKTQFWTSRGRHVDVTWTSQRHIVSLDRSNELKWKIWFSWRKYKCFEHQSPGKVKQLINLFLTHSVPVFHFVRIKHSTLGLFTLRTFIGLIVTPSRSS